jgi:hypothetical protein
MRSTLRTFLILLSVLPVALWNMLAFLAAPAASGIAGIWEVST